MGRPLDLNAAAAFAAIARSGGLAAAARATGAPRSTLGRQLAALEAALGVRLVQRTSRQFVLTDAGRRCAERIEAGLALIGGLAAEAAPGGALRGSVRLSVPVLLGQAALAPVLAAFCAQHPGVQLQVDAENRKVDLVREGYDFAIRAGDPGKETSIVRLLTEAEAFLFASEAYADLHGLPDTPAALGGHALIACTTALTTAWRFQRGAEATEVAAVPRIRVNDPGAAHALAMAGAGIAQLPGTPRSGDELRRVLPDWQLAPTPVWMVVPARRAQSRAARALIEAVYAAGLAPPASRS